MPLYECLRFHLEIEIRRLHCLRRIGSPQSERSHAESGIAALARHGLNPQFVEIQNA